MYGSHNAFVFNEIGKVKQIYGVDGVIECEFVNISTMKRFHLRI